MIGSNSYEKALKCFEYASCSVKDANILSYIIQMLIKGISKTNDENKKFCYYKIINSVVNGLK